MKWLLKQRTSFSLVEFLLICTGAFLVIYRASGHSPIVLYDTAAEESLVQWCLQKDLCPLYGGPTNLAGFWQGGAWIYLRTFFSWLGLTPGAVHMLVQVLDALAVGLVAVCGAMLHSRLAGIAAAAVAVWLLPQSEIIDGLHNSRFMFFPAALCTLLCLTAVRSRKMLPMLLAAAAAAVASNTHAACLPLVISVALVGALRSDRRLAAFFFWGGAAVLATFLLAPGLWSYQVASLLSPGASVVRPALFLDFGLSGSEAAAFLAALVLAARCVLQPLPSTPVLCTRALLAVLVPGLLLLVFSKTLVGIERNVTYFIFLIPAFSLALATAGLWLLEHLKPLGGKPAETTVAAAQTIAPYALGVALIAGGTWGDYPVGTQLLFEDLEELKQQLDSMGWDLDNQYRHVKNPLDQELPAMLLACSPIKSSAVDEEDAKDNLYVFKAPAARLPDALPDEWRISQRDDGSALVIVRSPTWLDWKSFSACTGTRCVGSGMRYAPPDYLQLMRIVPGLGLSGRTLDKRVQIRFPVRIPPGSVEHALIMPDLEFGCRGQVSSVPEGSRIMPGAKKALLASGDEPVSGTVVLQWTPGSAECPARSYRAFPPFFIEAEPETAERIDRLLSGGS